MGFQGSHILVDGGNDVQLQFWLKQSGSSSNWCLICSSFFMSCFRAVFSLVWRCTEMGDPGMSQVSSDVPEGKGVSSSAALEVATMSAIAAAYGKFLAYECVMNFRYHSLVSSSFIPMFMF